MRGLIRCRKRIANPFDGGLGQFVEQDAVEAAVGFLTRMAIQIMLSGENDAPLLGQVDTGGRAAEAGIAAQAHFNEDEYPPVPANQVHLATPTAKITQQYVQTVPFEEARGEFLGHCPRSGWTG